MSSESSEELDLTKMSPEQSRDLHEWAKTVNMTWEQIEALSEFNKDTRGDKTSEQRNANVVSRIVSWSLNHPF